MKRHLNQLEQEAIVVEQLEWLLEYEFKREPSDIDWQLVNALERVMKEFQSIEVIKDRS